MDWILALGGVFLIGLGTVARFRPNVLWRFYSLEPRWRKDNPEQPKDWTTKAKRQSYYLTGFGCIVVLMSIALYDL